MKKNKTEYKSGKMFFISFAASFFVLLTVMLPIAIKLSPISAAEAPESSSSAETNEFKPDKAMNMNVLCIDNGSDFFGKSFVLIRLDAVKKAIYVCALPPDLKLVTKDKTDSLLSLYEYGGSKMITDAVASEFGIELSKYAVFESEDIIKFINMVGAFEYNIPYNLSYKNTVADIFIKIPKGVQMIDGRTFLDLLRFPSFKEGYLHKYQVQGHSISQFINYNMNDWLINNLESLFVRTVNMTDNNLSMLDFETRKSLMLHFISLNYDVSEAIYISGDFNKNLFMASDKSKLSIKEHFS